MATNTGISWPSAPDASGNLTLAGNLTVNGTSTLVGDTAETGSIDIADPGTAEDNALSVRAVGNGLNSPAANQLALNTNGTQALLLDASQNAQFPAAVRLSAANSGGLGNSGILKLGSTDDTSHAALLSVLSGGRPTLWLRSTDNTQNGSLITDFLTVANTGDPGATFAGGLQIAGNNHLYVDTTTHQNYLLWDQAGTGALVVQGGSAGTIVRNSATVANLYLGANTVGFPQLKVNNSTTVAFRTGTDSADTPITAAAATFSGVLTVTSGGATITGNSTITGTLGSLTGLTLASGVATHPNGSASAPTVTFAGNSAYGWYFDNSNTALAAAVNGIEALQLTVAGSGSTTNYRIYLGDPAAGGSVFLRSNGSANGSAVMNLRNYADNAFATMSALSFNAQTGNVSIFNPTANSSTFGLVQGSSGNYFTGIRYVSAGLLQVVTDETGSGPVTTPGMLRLRSQTGAPSGTSKNVVASDSFTAFDNSNATAGSVLNFNLPTAAVGLMYSFSDVLVAAGSGVSVTPGGSDKIAYLNKGVGVAASSPLAAQGSITVVCTSANTWAVTSMVGTWT